MQKSKQFSIVYPDKQALIESRNALLQNRLRQHEVPFTIDQEYPSVLSTENHRHSFCVVENTRPNHVIAHGNLHSRTLSVKNSSILDEKNPLQVGLAGNIASAPEWEGHGLVKYLFSHFEKIAAKRGLLALILWTDDAHIVPFYQKLGFQSLGREWRINYLVPTLEKTLNSDAAQNLTTQEIPIQKFNQDLWRSLEDLRPKLPTTLTRSFSLFRTLLSCPATHLILIKSATDEIFGFFIFGKGCDMQGVVHEWGFIQPESMDNADLFLNGIKQWSSSYKIKEIMLLVPNEVGNSVLQNLIEKSDSANEHAAAMAKVLDKDLFNKLGLDMTYVWGLDSI